VGLSHFELVMPSERFLKPLDGDLRKSKRRRVEAAGIAGNLTQPDRQRMCVGLREVEREDADARAFERLTRGTVAAFHENASAAEAAETPAEKDHGLGS